MRRNEFITLLIMIGVAYVTASFFVVAVTSNLSTLEILLCITGLGPCKG